MDHTLEPYNRYIDGIRKGYYSGSPGLSGLKSKYYPDPMQELQIKIQEQKTQEAESLRRAIASISAIYNAWGIYREGFSKIDNDYLAENQAYALCEKATMDYLSTVDWTVENKQKRQLPDTIDFLESPNSQGTMNDLLTKTSRDVIRYDAGVWAKSLTLDKELVEIQAYHGPEFWIEVDRNNQSLEGEYGIEYNGLWSHGYVQRYWQHSRAGFFQPFDPDEITYFMMYPRSDSPYGTDFIQNLKWQLEYLLDSTKAAGSTFANGVMPGMIWKHPNISEATQLRERLKDVELELKGPDGFNGIFHTIGEESIDSFLPKLIDMQWLQGQEFVSKMVWAMFGFSASEFSSGDINRATAYIQKNTTKSRMLYPMLRMFESRINRDILPFLDGYEKGWKFRFMDAVDPDDEAKKLQNKQSKMNIVGSCKQLGIPLKESLEIAEFDKEEIEKIVTAADKQEADQQDQYGQDYYQPEEQQEPYAEDYTGTEQSDDSPMQPDYSSPVQKSRKHREIIRKSARAGKNQRLDIFVHLVTS